MYVDFLRLVLEIINTVIATCLPQNPELVYALLHRQDVLAPLQVTPASRMHAPEWLRAVLANILARCIQMEILAACTSIVSVTSLEQLWVF